MRLWIFNRAFFYLQKSQPSSLASAFTMALQEFGMNCLILSVKLLFFKKTLKLSFKFKIFHILCENSEYVFRIPKCVLILMSVVEFEIPSYCNDDRYYSILGYDEY